VVRQRGMFIFAATNLSRSKSKSRNSTSGIGAFVPTSARRTIVALANASDILHLPMHYLDLDSAESSWSLTRFLFVRWSPSVKMAKFAVWNISNRSMTPIYSDTSWKTARLSQIFSNATGMKRILICLLFRFSQLTPHSAARLFTSVLL
jgi:hypothetical protein